MGALGIEREIELTAPVELVARLRDRVVPVPSTGKAVRDIASMGGDPVGREPVANVFFLGQLKVFFGSDITEHHRSCSRCFGRADGARNVIVARRDA